MLGAVDAACFEEASPYNYLSQSRGTRVLAAMTFAHGVRTVAQRDGIGHRAEALATGMFISVCAYA